MNYYFFKKMPLPIWPCTFSRNFTPRGVKPKKEKNKNKKPKARKLFTLAGPPEYLNPN